MNTLVRCLLLTTGCGIIIVTAVEYDQFPGAQRHIPQHLRIDDDQFEAIREASRRGVTAMRNRVDERAAALSGSTLATAIRYSRNQAWTAKPQPIPESVASTLRPFFPAETIRRTRWAVVGRRLSLGTVLSGWYFTEGAVTLNDVVVFSNSAGAQSTALWAHELVHVRQYEELGVDEFARLYVTHWPVMEEQARANAVSIIQLVERGKATRVVHALVPP